MADVSDGRGVSRAACYADISRLIDFCGRHPIPRYLFGIVVTCHCSTIQCTEKGQSYDHRIRTDHVQEGSTLARDGGVGGVQWGSDQIGYFIAGCQETNRT